jgi:hypothetical protein
MKKFDLFSCPVYKTRLDPSLYNKDDLYKSLEKNFMISPERLSPSDDYPVSSFHTYHEDWDNPKFEKISLEQLYPLYDKIIQNFLDNEVSLNVQYEYLWNIANVNVGKDGIMQTHNHILNEKYSMGYVMIHYMSFDKEKHAPTRFINYSYLKHNPNIMKMYSYIDKTDPKNSFYCENFSLTTEEDDVIIFPYFLEHCVSPTNRKDIDKLRIIVATNIDIIRKGD